jgi:uncharacterized membrane protein
MTRLFSMLILLSSVLVGTPEALAQSYVSFDVPFPGARETEAFGVNNWGQIVGRYEKTHTVRGFLRNPNGAFFDIFVPGSTFTAPRDINDYGYIVGRYLDAVGVSHGFVLSGGGYRTVDYPGADDTRPRGISNTGVIVGNFRLAGVEHGFILDASGYHVTDFPGSAGTDVWDLDNMGEVAVGDWTDADGNVHAYTLANYAFTPFDVSVAGAWATSFRGINRHGTIVGVYAVDLDNDHGLLLTRTGQQVLLDFPGAPSTDVMAINDAGLIVGNYLDRHGRAHSFILR